MDEIKRVAHTEPLRMEKLLQTPAAVDALAFAALLGGGYAALRVMGLLLRLFGVD